MRWHKVNIEGLFRGLVIAVSLARLSLLYLGISDTLQMRLIPLFKVRSVQGVREKIEHGECNDKAHWLEAGFTAKPPKQTKLSISVFPSLSGWVLCILLGPAVVCWEMVFVYFGFFCSFMCCFCAVSKCGKIPPNSGIIMFIHGYREFTTVLESWCSLLWKLEEQISNRSNTWTRAVLLSWQYLLIQHSIKLVV